MKVGQDLLNVPFGEMVLKLGLAIAEGQTKLDSNSIQILKAMNGQTIEIPQIKDPSKTHELSPLALGLKPTFYQFTGTAVEVKMAITMANLYDFTVKAEGKAGWGPFAVSVDASYANKYEYKAEGSSSLRTNLTPVPPPAILQKYMEALIDYQFAKEKDNLTPQDDEEK